MFQPQSKKLAFGYFQTWSGLGDCWDGVLGLGLGLDNFESKRCKTLLYPNFMLVKDGKGHVFLVNTCDLNLYFNILLKPMGLIFPGRVPLW